MLTSLEITVSKLFPAGFCWQAGSVVAADMGFGPRDVAFAVTTGAGDAMGVGVGHIVFKIMKKALCPTLNKNFGTKFEIPDLKKESQVSVFLSTATFCSGFAWQPTLNTLQDLGASFPVAFAGVGAVCGISFFIGLRGGRAVYPALGLHVIEKPNPENRASDASLSLGIGGAAGMFVGTDVSFVDNPFKGFVGVTPEMAPLAGMVQAGKSTATGFIGMQTIQNTVAAVTYQSSNKPSSSVAVNESQTVASIRAPVQPESHKSTSGSRLP